ncbi:MAG TPA: BolA family transcriptional regulator [Methylococcaceae bacterium]|nr:BolA family transcriptional regulator [Methylococcaceae bacterium]
MTNQTIDTIRHCLTTELKPTLLEIIDNSAAHSGHAGARKGGGHYNVTIVSSAFENKTLVARHQLIYGALGELMKQDIHALGINALTPTEENKG